MDCDMYNNCIIIHKINAHFAHYGSYLVLTTSCLFDRQRIYIHYRSLGYKPFKEQKPCCHKETARCSVFFLRPMTLWLLFVSAYERSRPSYHQHSSSHLLTKSRLNVKLEINT